MTDSSTILLVDDDEAVRKVLSFPLERDGYEVIQAADGEEALERFGEQPGRPRRARHDAAEARRARGLQAAARPELGADHHAHGPRRRARQGPRARARRRRLRHEAVLDPRVPLARRGRSCAGRGRRGTSRAAPSEHDHRARRSRDRPAAPVGRGRRAAGRSSPTSSSSCSRGSRAARAASSAAGCCSRRSGEARSSAIRARSTSTCAICARSSSATRATRSSSSPFAASGTASATGEPASARSADGSRWRCSSSSAGRSRSST